MQPYNEQPPYNVPASSYGAQPAPYTGNRKDLTAFLAMLAGAGLLITSCIPGAACLLPIAALVGGIIGLRGADEALNPSRTRTYAWIGIVTGGFVLLLFVGIALLYGGLIVAAISEAQRQTP